MTEPDNTDLAERIARAKAAHLNETKAKQQADSAANMSAGAMALRHGAELGANVFVGIMIGLAIDHFFKTKPWGLLIMMGFGLAAGVRGVIRAYRELTIQNNPVMNPQNSGPETEELKQE